MFQHDQQPVISLVEVTKEHDIAGLAILAAGIWREHYTAWLGERQVEYMLDRFQSEVALRQRLSEDYRYYWLLVGEQAVGYFGIKNEAERLYLSKYYLRQRFRGQGLGRIMMKEIERQAQGLKAIYLNVNKANHDSIEVYKRLGFALIGNQTIDIGHGFVMDDYIFEKPL